MHGHMNVKFVTVLLQWCWIFLAVLSQNSY